MGDYKTINIFAKPASYVRRGGLPYRHLFRGSSVIRGEQIASYLGAKMNPTNGHDGDLCIYVKPTTLDHIKDGSWVDILDGDHIIGLLNDRPRVNAILNGMTSYNLFHPVLKNKLAVIPLHHCNFDGEMRNRMVVDTVGFIGSEKGFGYLLEEMKQVVGSVGLNFVYNCDFKTREDVVDFYKKIDIQVVWSHRRFRQQSRGPMKFINAASFGIPTVGYPQECCKEIEGDYIKAGTIAELMLELDKLKDPYYYGAWSRKAATMAEQYHISKIAELYRQL